MLTIYRIYHDTQQLSHLLVLKEKASHTCFWALLFSCVGGEVSREVFLTVLGNMPDVDGVDDICGMSLSVGAQLTYLHRKCSGRLTLGRPSLLLLLLDVARADPSISVDVVARSLF